MNWREAEDKLFEIISAFYYSRGLYAAAELEFADILKDGPLTAEEIAQKAVTIQSPATDCCEPCRLSMYSNRMVSDLA